MRDGPPVDADEEQRVRAKLESRLLGATTVTAHIGRFALLERVGRGGMGVVFAAYDSELDRKVAIKLLHADLDRPELRDRLRREAQAMARLTHPNVATVYEFGEHEDRAFVAMEFVKGPTLRAWVAMASRSWRELVDAYVQAGRGLAAAHGAGIVHRDFKPDNAIVGVDGRIRVLDFGLAYTDGRVSSTSSSSDDDDMSTGDHSAPLTREGTRIGTPAYMAPEQILGERGDAQTDQFSFCVALWEALAGARPFAGATLAEIHAHALAGEITAPDRGRIPKAIETALRRGLRREPAERHASFVDLLRVLERDPHRTRRRMQVLAGLAVVAAAVVGARFVHAESQRRACERSGDAIAEIWNADAAAAVTAGMLAIEVPFAAGTVERALPALDERATHWRASRTEVCMLATTSSADHVSQSAACLDEAEMAFADLVTILQAPDLAALERALPAIGQLPRAPECLDETKLARRPVLPTDERAVAIAEVEVELAAIRTVRLLGHDNDANQRSERALEHAKELDWPPLLARALFVRGMGAMNAGNAADAEALLQESFFHAAKAGLDQLAGESAMQLVYTVGYQSARYDDALQWARLGEVMLTRADASDLAHANLIGNIGLVDLHRGRHADALAKFDECIELAQREYGTNHLDLAGKLSNRGEAQKGMGDFAGATASFERAMTIMETSLGVDHPRLAFPLIGLGDCAVQRGDFTEGLAAFERAAAIRQRALGETHPLTWWAIANVGNTKASLGDSAGGLAMLERAVGLAETHGIVDYNLAGLLTDLGMQEHDLGRHEVAYAHLERALRIKEGLYGRSHRDLASTLVNLANTEISLGRSAEAQEHFARSLEIEKATYGAESPRLAFALIGLGGTSIELGETARGLELLESAVDLRERTLGPDHPLLANALVHLGDAEVRFGRANDAQVHAHRGAGIYREAVGSSHGELARALLIEGRAASMMENYGVAIRVLDEALVVAEAASAARSFTEIGLANIRLALATALTKGGGDRARARELARSALAAFRTGGAGFAEQVGESETLTE